MCYKQSETRGAATFNLHSKVVLPLQRNIISAIIPELHAANINHDQDAKCYTYLWDLPVLLLWLLQPSPRQSKPNFPQKIKMYTFFKNRQWINNRLKTKRQKQPLTPSDRKLYAEMKKESEQFWVNTNMS